MENNVENKNVAVQNEVKVDNTEVLKELDNVMKKLEEKLETDNFVELDFKTDCRIYGYPDQVKKLFESYTKYFGEVTNPKNTKTNPFHKSKYAPLEEVLNAVKEIMSKYGLGLVQFPVMSGMNVVINNMLIHKDGAYITFRGIEIKPQKMDAQGIGGAITYGRRYSASPICGVSSEEDDDGNGASGINKNKPAQNKTNAPKQQTNNKQSKQPSAFEKLKKEVGDLAVSKSKEKDDNKEILKVIDDILGEGNTINKSTSKDMTKLKQLKEALTKL